MTAIAVLSVASEIFPLIKTGGLADVAGALPTALAREDVAIRTLLPGYRPVVAKLESAEPARAYADLFGGPARVLAGRAAGLDLFVLDAPHLFDRVGNPYLGPDGRDWGDNAQRFAALARVGADLAKGAVAGYAPDVVHAHDWQAALTPVYLHYDGGPRPKTIVTIHNIAFQGHFPASDSQPRSACPRARCRSTGSSTSTASATSKAACSSPTASPPSRRPTRAKS